MANQAKIVEIKEEVLAEINARLKSEMMLLDEGSEIYLIPDLIKPPVNTV